MVEKWLKAGHDITVMNTWSERAVQNTEPFADDVKLVWGSITDKEIVSKTIRDQDVTVALAARVNVDESIGSPGDVVSVNVLGTQNILDAAVRHGVRVIYGSSCEVYGSARPLPVTEETVLKPRSPYAASKAAADRLCYAYHETYDLDVTIVRPCNIYGERQKEGKGGAVIAIFTQNALLGNRMTVFGKGDQRREYMHVSDVVGAYDLILNRFGLGGETFNCGTGETKSVMDIAEFVAKKTGAKIKAGPERPGEVDTFLLDSSKIKELGFATKVSFAKGINAYIDWRIEQDQQFTALSIVAN